MINDLRSLVMVSVHLFEDRLQDLMESLNEGLVPAAEVQGRWELIDASFSHRGAKTSNLESSVPHFFAIVGLEQIK